MRLIDADELLTDLYKLRDEKGCRKNSFALNEFGRGVNYATGIVEERPTVYDVDKVVEELENFLINYGIPKKTNVHKKIIDIVNRGGVDEK